MEQHLLKLVTQLTVIAVIAYVVASAVGKRELMQIKPRSSRRVGRGDMWQTPVATAPMPDEYLIGVQG